MFSPSIRSLIAAFRHAVTRGPRRVLPWVPLFGLATSTPAAGPVTATRGQVVFQSNFEGAAALRGWAGRATLAEGYQSAQAAALEAKPGQPASLSLRLPVETMRGCTVRGSALVKADQVSAKPNAWNGIKFMLAIETAETKLWPQAPLDTGTFGWKRASFVTRIPSNATVVTLVLGLEQVTGKVWFDDLKLTVTKPPVSPQPQPLAGPVFKGHNLPRLRGTMVAPSARPEDLRTLGNQWKANLIRWQLIRTLRPNPPTPLEDYDAWLESQLKKLDALLPVCEEAGLWVLVDLHSPPGGRSTQGGYFGTDSRLFTDRACQDKFVANWRGIAARYKNAKAVWGYDLANEPVEEDVAEDCLDWHDLAERAGQAIRQIDPQRAIICEAPPWGGPASLAEFTPIAVSNVVYSVHMYEPMAFTHQGVFNPNGPQQVYPGIINGKQWDAAALEAVFQPVIDFQRNFNVHIYIGEFSAIRWAPDHSACRYLADLIGIMEKHGWDWSYHAFREWSGWSVEHGEDRADTRPALQPTDRQQLLQSWFSHNQKPGR